MTLRAQALAKSKNYTLDNSGRINNADISFNYNGNTIAHATKCPLGEGQNASIYLAQNLNNGEWLAVKVYNKLRDKEKYHVDNREQINIEKTVLNILGMYKGQHKVDNNTLHVYMPFIDGIDLDKASEKDIGSIDNALHYAQIATQELLKLHQHNFIHADLHAGNIMICPQTKELKLIDFEKCMYMEPETKQLEIWGRPNFLPNRAYEKSSPRDQGKSDPIMVPVNKETDRYGLGMALFTLFEKVLGKDALSIDKEGNIQLKRKPQHISEKSYHELVDTLHLLTKPLDKGGSDDLNRIASAFNNLRSNLEVAPKNRENQHTPVQNTFLPSFASNDNKASTLSPAKSQIIGIQAIGAKYHFTQDDPVIEQAKRMLDMGSNMVKFSYDGNKAQLDKLLAMPFSTYFMWWRSGEKKCNLTEEDKKTEYNATYQFVKKLLEDKANQDKTFFLGHWEGDWYLLDGYDASKDPSPEMIKGMTEWLNIRQKAVDDARRDVGSKAYAKVFHYTEVNRVRDAMEGNKKRIVNAVLPNTNVDCVSYSSYDVQHASTDTIKATLDYIENKLPKKSSITGPRVFIGEFGVQAKALGYNATEHEKKNREIMTKFLKCDVPYILYWQMYDNEFKNDQYEGFWLVDNKNQQQPLYHTLKGLYQAQAGFNHVREQSISHLENMKYRNENSLK